MSATAPQAVTPHKAELVVAQLESLPALSPVVARILSLTSDNESSARQVAEIIERDPSLTARVLSIVRRAEHGVRTESMTVARAVALLGFGRVRHAALTTKVMEIFGPPGAASERGGFDRAEFWKHSLATGCAARRIAARLGGGIEPDEAFVSGLLHDLGKAALDTCLPKSFDRIVRTTDASRADISDVERSLLGVDHAVIGRRLAERWDLPRRLVECIWLHHHEPDALPASVAAGRHVQIVQLADALVRQQRIGYSGNWSETPRAGDLAEGLGLSESDLDAVAGALFDEIESCAEWIGLADVTSRALYQEALARTTEELSAANAALSEQNRSLGRRSEYFAALGRLSESVATGAAVHEACGAAAEATARALGVGAVLVFAAREDRGWADVGFFDGAVRSELIELPGDWPDEAADVSAAAEVSLAGTPIQSAGTSFQRWIDVRRAAFIGRPAWLMPILRERRWVAGALFPADAEAVAALRCERAEIEALGSAAGLVISQAQARSNALAIGEELAEAQRRFAAMQPELLRARTLETIAAMAAGAAHEMNNPLAVISGRAQMLRGRTADPDAIELLNTISAQAAACSDIVSELMAFARPQPPKPERIDVPALLDGLRREYVAAGRLDETQLAIDVASDTPPVHFDPGQLTRTIRELLDNAVAATDPDARRIAVKARANLAEMGVVLDVIDNGVGMTSAVRERALDPFYSHRAAGRGRGLGLARVDQWVRQNGGTIRMESRPDEGTRVELRLRSAGRRDE